MICMIYIFLFKCFNFLLAFTAFRWTSLTHLYSFFHSFNQSLIQSINHSFIHSGISLP
ncbi:hypothetical protein HELRODRAFT_191110 [Helobdella robusta]|uniref:Uncharacterized protein n=1 Tax=Helobdella robusta TaxID=6412 RepID=T1FSL6_HELRO|nr:hypothetical protein HELRODRAFT_191110 [Helobdella robusta]ESO07252.1 hypothetical protein HELRODRAFT_191110 [Helobdella robusta]